MYSAVLPLAVHLVVVLASAATATDDPYPLDLARMSVGRSFEWVFQKLCMDYTCWGLP